MLEANSFEILESSSDQTILYENSAREFFADIKRLGIQGGGSKLTQPQVSELVAAYQNKYSCYIVDDVEVSQNSLDLYPRAAAAVKATYHYGFYIAKKRSS